MREGGNIYAALTGLGDLGFPVPRAYALGYTHAAPWALIIVQRISCRWWATLRFETTLQGSLFLDPRFRGDDILFLTG